MHPRFKFIFPLLLTLLIAVASNGDEPPKKLTLAQAVQAAEKFIVLNGYTDLPPVTDHSKLSYESITLSHVGMSRSENIQRELQMRHDTLNRKAYGYAAHNRRSAGWTIVFLYKKARVPTEGEERSEPTGRAVTMDPFGRNTSIEHMDFLLKAATRLKGKDKKHFPRSEPQKPEGK